MVLGGAEDAIGAALAVSGGFTWPVAAPRHGEETDISGLFLGVEGERKLIFPFLNHSTTPSAGL